MMRRPPALTINFATTDFRFIHRVRIGLLAAFVALVCLAGVMLAMSVSYRSRTAEMELLIRELALSEEKLRPAMQEREQLMRNLSGMSSLMDARRFSWTRILTAIEEVFPAGVALNRLEFDPPVRAVAIEGEARDPEALSGLMIGLQKTANLKNPLLKRQSMEKGTLSFHVTFNYHEVLAAGTPPAAVRRTRR
jgi:Tfp pilus assembly protein PilN